jgi:hypothetical protein
VSWPSDSTARSAFRPNCVENGRRVGSQTESCGV